MPPPARLQSCSHGVNACSALGPIFIAFTRLRVRSIVARFTQCLAVTDHILQFWVFVPVLDMVRCCGFYRQSVFISSAVSFALFAQIPGPAQYHFTPSFVFRAVIIRIIWHIVFAPFGYHASTKPPPASYWRSPAGQEGGIGPDQAHPEIVSTGSLL